MELRRHRRVRRNILLATALQLLAAVFGVLGLLISAPTTAADTVPHKINFQGRLTDNSGNVLADGLYNIKFRFWDDASAGNNEWQEDRVMGGADRRVQVTNGLFNIQFGDYTAVTTALMNNVATGNLWLEVELPTPATATCATNGCAVFTEGAMTPRQPLGAAPYALNSESLDGLDSDAFVQLSAGAQTGDINISGDLTVGTLGAANTVAYLCHNSSDELATCSTTGTGTAILQGGNTLGAPADIGSNDSSLNLRANNATRLTVTTGGDVTFVPGGTRTINVGQAASGAGNDLMIAAGQSNTGAVNGGNLLLRGGATGGSGTSGAVIVQSNGTNNIDAFMVKQANSTTVLKVDTSTGRVVIGAFADGDSPNAKLEVQTGIVEALRVVQGGAFNLVELRSSNNNTESTRDTVTIDYQGKTTFRNMADSTSAFIIQNDAGEAALTADTTANKIVVGDATGTDTDTTLFVTDTATADPATGYNGAIYYNSTSATLRCYQGGVWVNCVTLPVSATANSTASFTASLNNVAANSAGVAAETLVFTSATAVSSAAGVTGFTAPANGSFRSCMTKNEANITAGTFGVRWRVNGASVGSAVCPMDSTVALRRQSASTIDSGVVTFSAGDTIGIAYDTNAGFLPSASQAFTTYWSVEYNASSGDGLTMQFIYDNSSSPATVNLSNGKNVVWNAADTATDPSYLINLQCTTCSALGGRFAVQNGGTDVFTVSPNSGGIALAQSATFTSTAILSRNGAGTGDSTLRVTGTPINDATSSLVRVGNAIAGGNAATDGGTYLGINAPSSGAGAAADFLNLQGNGSVKMRINSFGDQTTAFTALNGTSTANGSGSSSTSLILTSAANFDIGNYVQVNSNNCGGTGVNPCYAKITNKVSNTLTITPALTWANNSTVNEYHLPEIGATNTSSTLANRYGRGYFVAGVAAGNGTTFYNEDSIETDLTTFDLLTANVTTLNIGTAATSLTLGNAGTTVDIAGALEVAGTPGVDRTCLGGEVLDGITTAGGIVTGGTCSTPVGGGGANTNLSNLANGAVAINTSLVSDTTNTDDLGSSSITWRNGYFGTGLEAPLLQAAAATALTITANGASTWSTSTGQLTLQSGSGTLSLGSTTTVTAGGALSIDSNTTNALNLGTGANGKTVTIGNATNGTAVTIDTGTGGINLGDNANTKTIDIGGVTNSGTDTVNIATNATAADTVTIGSTNTSSKVTLTGGVNSTTTNIGVVIGGGTTVDSNQINLILDSASTYNETASSCTTGPVNTGAMYYNTASASIRTCINGTWEDVMTTAGMGILTFGIVPDSGANPGDLPSLVTAGVTGPCKVSWLSATSVRVAPCTAYSGGRKVVVAQTDLTLTTTTTNLYENVCLTGTNNQPALVGPAATQNSATIQPTFSAIAPILCLATLRNGSGGGSGNGSFAVGGGTPGNIFDTRTFTTTQKDFATTAATVPALGQLVVPSGTAVTQSGATANLNTVVGVVVAVSGAASATNPSAIIATSGPAHVTATAGTAGQYVASVATAGFATTTATSATSNLGTSRTTFAGTCTSAATCRGSLYFNIRGR